MTAAQRVGTVSLLALAVGVATGCGGGGRLAPPVYSAEIARTSFGIPHVTASDEAGLAYGVGYAQAQDGICGLAEQFVVVSGERARHFGAGEPSADARGLPEHVASDFFYRLLNDDAAVQAALNAQSPTARKLIAGWVRGYNRWLRDTDRAALPEACRNAAWVREVEDADLVRLVRYYTTLNDAGSVWGSLASAAPSSVGAPVAQAPRPTASNALALGRDGSDNGRGLLLGNPHFPWHAPLRLMQLHARIPGQIDTMGATLPGIPLVAIGFNQNFAWSHTTSTSAHATVYRLALDPANPTNYIVDGQTRPMQRKTLSVAVRNGDGTLRSESREVFGSDFGWLMAWESTTSALAYRSANVDNHRMLDEWWGINRARTLAELKAHVQGNVGNPWNNTLAADKEGRTLMLTVSPVPRVSAERLAQCQVADLQHLASQGVFALHARGGCEWQNHPAAPQAGVFAGSELPVIERGDFVHNANDSAWQANPAQPLSGFSPLISADSAMLEMRPRYGLSKVTEALAGAGRMSFEQVQQLVMGNRVHLADLLLPDLLSACAGEPDLAAACAALGRWDRTANSDAGIGYGYFERFAANVPQMPAEWWRVPFDPARPVSTPSGLGVDDPGVRAAVLAQLRAAVAEVDADGLWADGRRWGDIQRATRGATSIAIHGGGDRMGVYNAIESARVPGTARREVIAGTSWLQVVGFDAEGPRAMALLTYSQQQDPKSPHAADQTQLFSGKKWVTLPFTAEAINADPALQRRSISQ